MILMIDNYDSFTYNLVQYLYMLGETVTVKRNDQITVDEALALEPKAIVVSPGPGRPGDAGVSVALIKAAAGRIPLLGVCLGHQSIGVAFGGKIVKAQKIMHGKISDVEHDGKGVFQGVANPIQVVRYHSLVIAADSLPDCLEVTARTTDDGEIMGVRHRESAVEGIQYHPESVLTPTGKRQMANFIAGIK